jgi:hypothetical protein
MEPIMVKFGPTRRVERHNSGWRVFVKPPSFVGDLPEQHVDLNADQFVRFLKWHDGGGMVQDLLPDLTTSQREILISGLGDEEFERFTD